MPDVYLCMDGVPVWLELKIIKNKRTCLSRSQIAWHLAHTRCGGVSFFLLHAPSTGDVFLFDGGLGVEISESRSLIAGDCDPAPLWCGPLRAAPANLRACALELWDMRP